MFVKIHSRKSFCATFGNSKTKFRHTRAHESALKCSSSLKIVNSFAQITAKENGEMSAALINKSIVYRQRKMHDISVFACQHAVYDARIGMGVAISGCNQNIEFW